MTVTEESTGTELKDGRIVGIAGPVIDVEFPRGHLPEINTALELDVTMDGETTKIVAETAQQLGGSRVRAICMKPTDGLIRGTEVRNLRHPLQMPVGDGVLGVGTCPGTGLLECGGAPPQSRDDVRRGRLVGVVVPVAVLAWWFLRHPEYRFQRRAFGITLAGLVPLGFLLNILFGHAFFTFENRAATLGVVVPVVGGSVPVEEFAFYALGFLTMLLLYVWCDEYWLGSYNVPDYKAEEGESYFTLVHGIAHESSVSFVAVLQATRALRKGFESAIYFYGPGAINCLATRGFPTTGDSGFPGEQNINESLESFISEGGTVFCCRFGLGLHGGREEDLIEGVIPAHPLDVQDALIHYARKGAIINSTYMV